MTNAMRMARGARSQKKAPPTPETQKKIEKLRSTLGSINHRAGGNYYKPKKWMVEETGQDSFSVIDRVTGEMLCDGFLHHKIAVKLVKLLNEGDYVNDKGPARLLALNLEFNDLLHEVAGGKDEAASAANAILEQIDAL